MLSKLAGGGRRITAVVVENPLVGWGGAGSRSGAAAVVMPVMMALVRVRQDRCEFAL